MAELRLQVGDTVRETKHGRISHRQHHEGPAASIPSFQRLREGVVVEVRDRWFLQPGQDVRVKWADETFDWRQADDEHLKLIDKS
jgi:hypothetical protein